MAEQARNTLPQCFPDGIVPEDVVTRTERRWLMTMVVILILMLVVVVLTSTVFALHPASNVEVISPLTLHLEGEFVETNLGTAIAPDGSATVRLIAQQYDFVPRCVEVPVDTPVRFRLTSADVIHGFLLPHTNVNTMVVPGFIAEVRTRFDHIGSYTMPCHEFCGLGHHGMWTEVIVVDKDRFATQGPFGRLRCERQ